MTRAARRRGFSEDLLSAYVDGELDPDERARVERELERSPGLRDVLDEIEDARALVRGLSPCDLDAEVWRRIHAVVGAADSATASRDWRTAEVARRTWRERIPHGAVAGMVAAAAAGLLVVAVAVPEPRVAPDVTSLAEASVVPGGGAAASSAAPDLAPEATGRKEAGAPSAPADSSTSGKWRYLGRQSAPEDTVQLRYANEVSNVSVFVRDGSVDWGALSHGHEVTVDGHRARVLDAGDALLAVVWGDGGLVFTCVGDAERPMLLLFARRFASGAIEGQEGEGVGGFLLGPFRWR